MRREKCAGVAQLAEQLICNQQVGGSNPSTSSTLTFPLQLNMGEFPSGQRGQTVNLLSLTSVVRIHLPPPSKRTSADVLFALLGGEKEGGFGSPCRCTFAPYRRGGTWQSQRPLDAPPRTIPAFLTGGETPPLRVMQESPFFCRGGHRPPGGLDSQNGQSRTPVPTGVRETSPRHSF